MASTKKNILFNLALTTCNYIFPLITYPYISRVLGVDNIGICGYVDSIINYLVLFSALGVGALGVREIARVKGEPEKCNRLFSSLFSFNLVLTLVCIAILIVCTYSIPYLAPYKEFLLIGIIKLLFSAFLIEWFFQGISEFKYITIRSIAVRCVYVASIFIFVHSKADVTVYYLLTTLITLVNACFNWGYSRRFVKFSLKDIDIRLYIVPILSYGLYMILTSMYTNFNVTYLGFVSTDDQVGYFVTATKLYTIIMSAFSAFTLVMVPKVSELLHKNDTKKLNEIARKTFDFILLFSIPAIIVADFYAPLIIDIISGKGYEGAVLPFRIVISLLLIIALEQIIIRQFIMATKNSRHITSLSLAGAIIGVGFNIALTKTYGAVGTSISWVMSEIAVLALACHYFRKTFAGIGFPFDTLIKCLVCALPYVIIGWYFQSPDIDLNSILGISLSAIWFIISGTFIIKSPILLGMLRKVKII